MKLSITMGFATSQEAIDFLQLIESKKAEALAPAPEKPKRGRKAKAKVEQKVESSKSAGDPEKMIAAVYDKLGLEGARDLLSRFGAARVGDLPADVVDKFCAKAQRVLDGEAV